MRKRENEYNFTLQNRSSEKNREEFTTNFALVFRCTRGKGQEG
jgi:hypothetical protein